MNISQIEAEAKARALKHVCTVLQRPDQLGKVEQYLKKSSRKKASVESQLKNAVQSQLEGVKTGLNQLQNALEDLSVVKQNMTEVNQLIFTIPTLKSKLEPLRKESEKHSQYAAAIENVKHIFNVPETVELVKEQIENGKLLAAHKQLMDLETARDDLLFEMHKLQTGTDYDMKALKFYFADVEKLVEELGKQLWYILDRTLDSLRDKPAAVVTALRIIEREERIDQYCIERANSTGFMPVGRPKRWKDQCFVRLLKFVKARIDGFQLEDRSGNRQWLARYLEVCRIFVLDDLKVLKSLCEACFPPHYDIYNRFVKKYHKCLSLRLGEIASEELEKNELVQLLSWLNVYTSHEMLGHPVLKIDVDKLVAEEPLLPRTTIYMLTKRFLDITKADLADWLEKTIQKEKDDWYANAKPEADSLGFYYSSLPTILFQMVDDQVRLAREIGEELIPKVLLLNVEELITFATKYQNSFMAYKSKHLENRDLFQSKFTHTMICIANTAQICSDSSDKIRRYTRSKSESEIGDVRKSSVSDRQNLINRIDELKEIWLQNSQKSVTCLEDEVLRDINQHLADLLTKKWLTSNAALDTICATIDDYHRDHQHLRPHLASSLLMNLQIRVYGEYMRGIESRRISFATFEERRSGADKMVRDNHQLVSLFSALAKEDLEVLKDFLPAVAGVLELRDKSLLALEVSSFVQKFRDISVEQLTNLILLREDTNKAEARQLAEEIVKQNRLKPKQNSPYSRLFATTNPFLA